MSKPIKSTDPRKPSLVADFKRLSNCRKVTNVREIGPGLYTADCMWPNGADARVGAVQIADWSVRAPAMLHGPKARVK